MANPLSAAGEEAKRLAKQFPDVPTKTLARRLAKSHKITIEQARSRLRYRRGNQGKEGRKKLSDKDDVRPNQPSGWKPAMPPSLAEDWTPFELGNGIKVAILSDVHIPYHSTIAFESAVKHCKKKRPDVVLLNGDFADFYSISRHQKDPSKRDFKQEIELVQQGLGWIRDQFPKSRIVFKLGNHEERWQHWLWNAAPEISGFDRMNVKEWIEADRFGVEVVGDQRPVMVGNLPVLHGHEGGRGATFSQPVNPARGVFMKTLSTMLVGHGHRTSHHVETDWRHKQISCWSSGCLTDLYPEYARINKWDHGATTVEVDLAGDFHVSQFRVGPNGEVW